MNASMEFDFDAPDPMLVLDSEPAEKKVLEKHIEQAVCRYAASEYGMLAEKFVTPGRRSAPDRIFTTVGAFIFFIEFKAPKKKATEKQYLDHERRRKLGCIVFVCDDVAEGKVMVDLMYADARRLLAAKEMDI